jgi:hypothetical protein
MASKVATNDNTYAPRQSQRVDLEAHSDGDVWQEKLAVCEGEEKGQPKLLIRSYYRNTRTGERQWDEPPSGAGQVLHADSKMRKTAENQRTELQLTLEMIPPDSELIDDDQNLEKKGKKGFFRRLRKKKDKKTVETAKDLNLQRVIALSIAEQTYNAGGSNEPVILYDCGMQNDDDEDIELAKALSLSTAEDVTRRNHEGHTEEEMFQRALEASRQNSAVARLPDFLDGSFSSHLNEQQASQVGGKRDPNEDYADDKDHKQGSLKFDP